MVRTLVREQLSVEGCDGAKFPSDPAEGGQLSPEGFVRGLSQ